MNLGSRSGAPGPSAGKRTVWLVGPLNWKAYSRVLGAGWLAVKARWKTDQGPVIVGALFCSEVSVILLDGCATQWKDAVWPALSCWPSMLRLALGVPVT